MAKNDYFSTISEKIIAESSGSKIWWNLVKRLLGSSKNRSIPPLQTDDDLICDNFAKYELINDFSVNNQTWTILIRQFRNLLIHFMTN